MTTVFVIEDEVLLRDFIVSFFESEPHFSLLDIADNGKEGLNQCLELKPDLLILDVMIPELNGTLVLEELKLKQPATKTLVFSTLHSPNLIHRIMRAQADGFIEKSAGLNEFRKAVEAVASGQSFFSKSAQHHIKNFAIHADHTDSLDGLTPREKETLQLIAEGNNNKTIASKLAIGQTTVETHRANLMRKVDLHTSADLTRFAIEQGLVSPNKISKSATSHDKGTTPFKQ